MFDPESRFLKWLGVLPTTPFKFFNTMVLNYATAAVTALAIGAAVWVQARTGTVVVVDDSFLALARAWYWLLGSLNGIERFGFLGKRLTTKPELMRQGSAEGQTAERRAAAQDPAAGSTVDAPPFPATGATVRSTGPVSVGGMASRADVALDANSDVAASAPRREVSVRPAPRTGSPVLPPRPTASRAVPDSPDRETQPFDSLDVATARPGLREGGYERA